MLEQTLKKLADTSESVSHRLLRSLSSLDQPRLSEVQAAWVGISAPRRRQIVHALVEMAEDDEEMDFIDLLRFMLADPDEDVRATAVSGLWDTSDERFVDPLIALMKSDASPAVRAASAEALGHFGALAISERLHGGRDRRLLNALLDTFHGEADPLNTLDVRRNALESVALFGDDERVMDAIRAAYAHPDMHMKAAAVSAMGFTVDPTWEPIILQELDNPEPEMRYEASRAAGDLWMEAAVPRLVSMTKDSDPEVRLMAIWSLGEIGGAQAKQRLTELLESTADDIRNAAEEALDELRFNENPVGLDDLIGPQGKGKKPPRS